MMARYNNALKVQDALNNDHLKTRAPTFLQVYEPEEFNGQGRAAIAINDPDHAANTAVVVPGTGNSVTEGWLGADDATNLYNETQGRGSDQEHRGGRVDGIRRTRRPVGSTDRTDGPRPSGWSVVGLRRQRSQCNS